MFPTCPIDQAVTSELAHRELQLQMTQPRRVRLAQRVLRRCSRWPYALTSVRVLEPSVDADGHRHWHVARQARMVFLSV